MRDRSAGMYRFVGLSRTGCAPTVELHSTLPLPSGVRGRVLAGTCVLFCGSALVRDSHAGMYRSVGLSRTSALPQIHGQA